MPTYFIYYISLCSNSAAYTSTRPTPPSSLLTVFSFRYIKKTITYHVAFSILPLAKLVEGVSGFFYNIYKERRKGRRIKGSSEKENFDPDDIKQKMVGREIKGHYYRVDNDGYSDEVVLKADCITTMESLLCFDLELHKQEILGIGGMVFSLANKNARENA